MENEPHHHQRQNSLHLPPPTPSRNGATIRHRSLSPTVLKANATRDADDHFASSFPRRRSFGPRPGIPNSPSRVGLRSSPLASRTLSELNTPSREEAIILSPVQLHYLKPRPLQALPPESPPADVSTSMCTSACSTPSSPFMELIYSASASTAETPDIFRQLDDEAKETPIMANPRHSSPTRGNDGCDVSSKGTYSLESMIHESDSAARHGVPASWVVPRILNTTLVAPESGSTNNEKSSTSPFSLPSMLGAANSSYDSEEISELESPMLFSATTEASDIQSRSEATDIYSLRTTPTHTLQTMISGNGGEDDVRVVPQSPLASMPATKSSCPEEADTHFQLPGPLLRCDAHDELDDLTECDSASTPNPAATTPSLTQLASSSGLLLSRQQVLDAAVYDSDSEILNEDPYIRRLQQQHARSAQEQVQPMKQKSNRRWMVHSQLFFQSPQTVQFPDMDGDDGMISELSSHQGDTRDVEQGAAKATTTDTDVIVPTATMASSADSASSTRSSRCFFAQSRMGLMCRLVTIVLLALCVLAPLVGFYIHSRLQTRESDFNNSIIDTDDDNIGLTLFPKRTTPPVTSSPTQAATKGPAVGVTPSPIASEATLAPTSSPNTPTPSQLLATLVPTVATVSSLSPSTFPSKAGLPTLPPVQSIWDEDTWSSQNESSSPGPLWETGDGSSLELTIVNSLTNPTHSDALEATIQDWEESSVRFNVVSDPPSTPLTSIDDCIPTLGEIHVCNGNFGDTISRFFSKVYVNDQQQIIAATVLQNDQFGIEGSDLLDVTPESLSYNYCHELGHSLGLFHATQGCMVEHILLETFSAGLFVRPDPSDLQILDAMYGTSL